MIPLIVIGINHMNAPVAIREKVAFAPEIMIDALNSLLSDTQASEAAILSTCNRTEMYLTAEDAFLTDFKDYVHWLTDYHGLEDVTVDWYVHRAEKAVKHMMSVACGLDSLVLGEPQILGQMKSCYAVAQEAGTLGSELHNVFQTIFGVAKRVRTETAIGRNPVSVAYTAVDLAKQIFSDLTQDTALLIGAGETIQLVARHLRNNGVSKIILANRTLERAKALAEEFNAEAVMLSDIPEVLVKSDIVISSTASQLPILGKGAVESALKQRKRKPIFMVDLAVPRDIESEVSSLEDIYLYTVDDLECVIQDNKETRFIASQEAEDILLYSVDEFLRASRARESVAVIKTYRNQAEQMRDDAIAKALRDLDNGLQPDEVVKNLANSLTNKLLHSPTKQIKQAGESGEADLLAFSQKLLGLPSEK